MSDDREQAFRALTEWANAPHAQLGFSEVQTQVQTALAALAQLRAERDTLRNGVREHVAARDYNGARRLIVAFASMPDEEQTP